MKYTLLISLLWLIIVMSLYSFVGLPGACKDDKLYEQELKKLAGFNLIKDYRVYLKPDKKSAGTIQKSTFPFVLNRGIKYKFLIAKSESYESDLILKLFAVNANNKPEFMIASNFMESSGKVYNVIEFKAETTINCQMEFTIKGNKEGCGVAIASQQVLQ